MKFDFNIFLLHFFTFWFSENIQRIFIILALLRSLSSERLKQIEEKAHDKEASKIHNRRCCIFYFLRNKNLSLLFLLFRDFLKKKIFEIFVWETYITFTVYGVHL